MCYVNHALPGIGASAVRSGHGGAEEGEAVGAECKEDDGWE